MASKQPRGRAGGEASQEKARAHSMGEWVIGYVPRRDGSDYNEDAPSPRWEDIMNLIEEEDITAMDIIFYGKIYMHSDKIGSDARHMDNSEDIFKVPPEVTPDEPDVPGSGSFARRNTAPYTDEFLGYEEGTVQHIVGVVIRKLA